MEQENIALGDRHFELRPLKLGQLRQVVDALDGMSGKSGGGLIEAAAGLVAAGLAPFYPEIAPESLLDLEATIEQLNAAVAAVLRIAGLLPMGESRPVASPEGAPENSSAPSMAPSPPAAATPTEPSTP